MSYAVSEDHVTGMASRGEVTTVDDDPATTLGLSEK